MPFGLSQYLTVWVSCRRIGKLLQMEELVDYVAELPAEESDTLMRLEGASFAWGAHVLGRRI